MARNICLKPCPPSAALAFHIPLMGGVLQTGGEFNLEGGCNGCSSVSALVAQIQPVLSSLGLPLCLLGCVASLIQFTKSIVDALGPPPDPSKLATALANIVTQCKCVVNLALPPPVGPICDFYQMTYDIVKTILTSIECVVGLLEGLITMNAKATARLTSPVPAIVASGSCLAAQVQLLTDSINGKFAAMTSISQLLTIVFDLLSVVPGIGSTASDLANAFTIFSGSTPTGTVPADLLSAMQTLQTTLQEIQQVMVTVGTVCPSFVP